MNTNNETVVDRISSKNSDCFGLHCYSTVDSSCECVSGKPVLLCPTRDFHGAQPDKFSARGVNTDKSSHNGTGKHPPTTTTTCMNSRTVEIAAKASDRIKICSYASNWASHGVY